MIVETNESPSSPELRSFDQELISVESTLHKIETYSRELDKHIRGIKKLAAINRILIAGLQDNEQILMSLLQEKPKDKKVGTCKVTNISELCWTNCESHILPPNEKQSNEFLDTHSEPNFLLSSLKKDFDRQKGGQEPKKEVYPCSNISQQLEIEFKVKCILKLVEELDLTKTNITDLRSVCRRVMGAMLQRNKTCCEHKILRSKFTLLSKNPYLSHLE